MLEAKGMNIEVLLALSQLLLSHILSGRLNITPFWKESCNFPKRVNGSCSTFSRIWLIRLDCNYLLFFLLNWYMGFLRVRTIFYSTWCFSSLICIIQYSLKLSLLFAQKDLYIYLFFPSVFFQDYILCYHTYDNYFKLHLNYVV